MSTRPGPLIAIDGPAGSGKSTLARSLARALDVPYVNTGLMYRALTARALRDGLDRADAQQLTAAFRTIEFGLAAGGLTIDREAPGADLASEEVEGAVSEVSGHPQVRELMRNEQRRLGGGGAVMEGRDIGSVVFPDADVKLYLLAEGDERAARRAAERGAEQDQTGTRIANELAARDARDERVNPFVPPDGAIVIDTTPNTPEDTLRVALDAIASKLGGAG